MTIMKRDEIHLSELTHLIYSASLHPERWNDAVARIHASMGANKSTLFTPFVTPQHGGIAFPVGFSQADLELWAAKFADKDYWGKKMQQKGMFVSGSVCTTRDLCPTEKEYQEFLDSPIYREYAMQTNIHDICVGVVFEGAPDLPPMVYSAWRSKDDTPFSAKDKDWMGLLITHVSRAMGIMMRLDAARLQKASLHASLDRMKFGVALLNDELQVLYLNRAAQMVLDRDDGISLNRLRILESRKADTRVHAFSRGQAGKTGKVKIRDQSHTLSSWLLDYKNMPVFEQQHFLHGAVIRRKVSNPDSETGNTIKKQYTLQCAPLPNEDLWCSNNDSARFIVFISDPQSVQLPDVEKLGAIYGLTETEAKIAIEFMNRGSYKEVAERLQVSENTVRWHIKNIYPKIGVSKLADLVRMVMALGESGV